MKLANYLEIKLLLTAATDQLAAVGVELLSNLPTDPVTGLFGEDGGSANREAFTAAVRELGAYEPGLVVMIKKAMVGGDMAAGVTALRAFNNFNGRPVGLQILAAKQAKGDVEMRVATVNGVKVKDIAQTLQENAENEASL